MSRSNPNENGSPNPSTRWFEWNGEQGTVRYYDKAAKSNVDVGAAFRFVLLDVLGTVKGWHDASDSGIYANEVKDTGADMLVVKSFKGGIIAQGIYRDIKDRVNAAGGQFVSSCYIAYKADDGLLAIGNIHFKGSALRGWMEFQKEHRKQLYERGIQIKGFTEGKKGRIVYRVPVLQLVELSPDSNAAAFKLDEQLQEYLAAYLKKPKREQAAAHEPTSDEPPPPEIDGDYAAPEVTEDDIPF